MKIKHLICPAIASLAICVGCSRTPDNAAEARIKELETEVQSLKQGPDQAAPAAPVNPVASRPERVKQPKEQAAEWVTRTINALQKRDFDLLYNNDYGAQSELIRLSQDEPQFLLEKKRAEHRDQKRTEFLQNGRFWKEYSTLWFYTQLNPERTVLEISGRNQGTLDVYVRLNYSALESSPFTHWIEGGGNFDGKLLKETVLTITFDRMGNYQGVTKRSDVDQYWKSPLRIVGVDLRTNAPFFDIDAYVTSESKLVRSEIKIGEFKFGFSEGGSRSRGGFGVFDHLISMQYGDLRDFDSDRGQISFLGKLSERTNVVVTLSVTNAEGSTDTVSFKVPAFDGRGTSVSRYYIREPYAEDQLWRRTGLFGGRDANEYLTFMTEKWAVEYLELLERMGVEKQKRDATMAILRYDKFNENEFLFPIMDAKSSDDQRAKAYASYMKHCEDMNRRLMSVLGDKYPQFDRYQKCAEERSQMQWFRLDLKNKTLGLDTETESKLIDVMFDTRSIFKFDADLTDTRKLPPGDLPVATVDRYIEQFADLQRQIQPQAKTLLSAEQFEVFVSHQAAYLRMKRNYIGRAPKTSTEF
jgi:hypothetical protein